MTAAQVLSVSLQSAHRASGEPPPAIVLMGPTASGKTRLALDLARVLPLEVVSVDSAQVYRDMNLGTAKPSIAQRAG